MSGCHAHRVTCLRAFAPYGCALLASVLLASVLLASTLFGCAVVEEGGPRAPESAGDGGPPPDAVAGPAPVDAAPPDAGVWPRDPVEIELIPSVPFDRSGRVRVAFEVPDDLRAVTLSADGPEAGLLVFEAVVDGAGRAWVSAAPEGRPIDDADRAALAFPGPFLSPNRVLWGDGVATAMLPGNPDVRPAPGLWSATLAVEMPHDPAVDDPPRPAPVDVYVQIERGPTPPRGRLDLHFHFTQASDWRADAAAMDPEFRRMLNVATVLLRDVGVDVGQVTYTDVPVVSAAVSVQGELPRLLALSARDTGVSVFIVGRVEDAVGGPLAGISGGVPASAGLPGTGANGVAIARDFADGQALGRTLAHELGHALGLFHTVEANPLYVDQLDDTAEGEAGRDNVMYPTAGPEARRFSPRQGEVMRRSRAVDGAP